MTSKAPPEVIRFAETAQRYCVWIEQGAQVPMDLMTIQLFLAELQLVVLGLRDLVSGDYPGIPKPDSDLKDRVLQRVSNIPLRYYWDTFDPLKENATADCSDLADDLADIWLGLWTGLQMFNAGHAIDANFHWKLLYDAHWGQHLLGAQRAIYAFSRSRTGIE